LNAKDKMAPLISAPSQLRPIFILISFIVTPVLFGVTFQYSTFDQLRDLLQPLGWVTICRVLGTAIVLYMLWFSWLYEQRIKPKVLETFKQSNKNPEEVALLITTSSCSTATVVGMVLYLLGASIAEYWFFAGISITGILFWAWRYRTLVIGPISES
jgi:hypothetical protein